MVDEQKKFNSYFMWLKHHWNVVLQDKGARWEVPFDPYREPPDPGAEWKLKESLDYSQGYSSDHITYIMGRAMKRQADSFKGKVVWEVGCGTALLSALSSKLGAKKVYASDADEKVLAFAQETSDFNKFPLTCASGNLFEGVPWKNPVDILIANLPQKPDPDECLPLSQSAGKDGLRWHLPFLKEAAHKLNKGGKIYYYVHSLSHPTALTLLHHHFETSLLSFAFRVFPRDAYSGLLPQLKEKKAKRESYFIPWNETCYAFISMIFEGVKKP